MKTVTVIGCCGRMGQAVCRHIAASSSYSLNGAVDVINVGDDLGKLINADTKGIKISGDLKQTLEANKPNFAIDFTQPKSVTENIITCIRCKTPVIVGTTGITTESRTLIGKMAEEYETPVLIVPNFSIGAVLMMEFAAKAARYMKSSEIIELHHDKKLDKPSGTSLQTRKGMLENKGMNPDNIDESIIPIHSVRLPGLLAHQEVILGDVGQTLTIRHDSLSRESFMSGIDAALIQIEEQKGLQIGLKLK